MLYLHCIFKTKLFKAWFKIYQKTATIAQKVSIYPIPNFS